MTPLHVCTLASALGPPPPGVVYLSAPLKRQATNRPARPGRSLKTSITKYNTIWQQKKKTQHVSKSALAAFDTRAIAVYLIVCLDVAFIEGAVLSVASKHDQTHQTT